MAMLLAEPLESCAMATPESVQELFVGRHFDREMIMLCVRWYLRFKLSLRELVEMVSERGLFLRAFTDIHSPFVSAFCRSCAAMQRDVGRQS